MHSGIFEVKLSELNVLALPRFCLRTVHRTFLGALLVLAGLSSAASAEKAEVLEPYGLGRPVSAAEIAEWDRDVKPDGSGLPGGEGSVSAGEDTYAKK